jgi:hypothetical protein
VRVLHQGGGNDILRGLSWCFALLDPARFAFFVAGGLAGEIMALAKKQRARRAAIIRVLTELSPNGWAKRGPGPLRIGLSACDCSLMQVRATWALRKKPDDPQRQRQANSQRPTDNRRNRQKQT